MPLNEPAPKRPRTPSSWLRREADGWFVFYPGEMIRCPAVDRRYETRNANDRRRADRPCDRSFMELSGGTLGRVKQVEYGTRSWTTPGGQHLCLKCGAMLEFQLIPVHPDLIPSPPHPAVTHSLPPRGTELPHPPPVDPRRALPPPPPPLGPPPGARPDKLPTRDDPPPYRGWMDY